MNQETSNVQSGAAVACSAWLGERPVVFLTDMICTFNCPHCGGATAPPKLESSSPPPLEITNRCLDCGKSIIQWATMENGVLTYSTRQPPPNDQDEP